MKKDFNNTKQFNLIQNDMPLKFKNNYQYTSIYPFVFLPKGSNLHDN